MVERLLEIALGNAGSAALLALVVLLATRLVRRPAVTHLLWTVVLLRLLMPPLLELPLLPAATEAALEPVTLAGEEVVLAGSDPLVGRRAPAVSLEGVAAVVWAIGVALVLGLAAVRISRLERLIGAWEPPSPALQQRIAELAGRMGLRRAPPIRVVDAPVSPMLWAPFRAPILVLPKTLLDSLDGPEHDTLIAHELAHLCRRDHLVRYLELLATAIFWWHPLSWWAGRQLRTAEEQCCDALVAISLPGHRRAYADCLVKTLRYVSTSGLRPQVTGSGLGEMKHVQGRITMIMTRNLPCSLSTSGTTFVLLLALAALVLSPTLACRSDEPAEVEYTGEPINLNLADADMRDVLLVFSEITHREIRVDSRADAAGLLDEKVTLQVSETPWDEVLDGMLEEHGLDATLQGETLWVHAADDAGPGFAGEPLRRSEVPALEAVPEAAEGDEPLKFVKDGDVTEPVKLQTPAPVYPEHLREEKVQGVVVLETVINAEGLVEDLKVLNDAHPDFAAAAAEAVRNWTFEPATLEGEPVAVKYILTARFHLK